MMKMIITIVAILAVAAIVTSVYLGAQGKLSFADDCGTVPVLAVGGASDGQPVTSFAQLRDLMNANPTDMELQKAGYFLKDGAMYVKACVEDAEVSRG